jgi:hypothetical protein
MSKKSRARWARKIRPLFTVYLPVLPYVLFAGKAIRQHHHPL